MITQEELKATLHYDEETGAFTWAIGRRKGLEAGCLYQGGNRVIKIKGKRFMTSHLAWLYVHGEMPERMRCLKANDYSIANLREFDQSRIRQDQRNPRIGSKSGLLGVTWDARKNKWKATITAGGKKLHIGMYKDKYQAHAAYLDAKKKYHPESRLALCQ